MIRRLILAALGALALTCASSVYQRTNATYVVEGEAWCPTPAPCEIPALGAGLPLPWLIDNPQISVPGSIFIFEDDVRPAAFLLDALAWFALILLALRLLRKKKKHYAESAE